MALDQYSLAALIQQQMGGSAPALDVPPLLSSGADYFWRALGDALRQAQSLSRLVASLPEAAGAAVRDTLGDLKPA